MTNRHQAKEFVPFSVMARNFQAGIDSYENTAVYEIDSDYYLFIVYGTAIRDTEILENMTLAYLSGFEAGNSEGFANGVKAGRAQMAGDMRSLLNEANALLKEVTP